MKKYILIIVLIFSINSFSQEINREDLVGNWKVVKIESSPSHPNFKPLIEGFGTATFFLNSDASFSIETKNKSQLFSMMTEMTNNSKWRYNAKGKIIEIGSKKDNYTIMGIIVQEINGKTYFNLEESNVILLMNKK